jgi:multidrug efflux pump subunit AcrB
MLLVGSCATFGKLPFIFFPDSERALVQVDINLPQGTRIESTDAAVAQVEAFITKNLSKEVVDTTAFIGKGPASYDLGYRQGESNSSYVHLLVNTAGGDSNQTVIDAINTFGVEGLPDAVVSARRLAGGGGGVPVEIRIFGADPAQLYSIGERLKKHLVDVPGSRNVTDNWGPRLKKFRINIKPNQLSAANLTNQDVAVSLQTVLTGFKTGEFRDDTDSIPITMRADDATGYTIEEIRNVAIHPMRGGVGVPLSQIADIELDWQYPRVRRRNLTRMYAVQSYLENGFTATDLVGPITDFMEADKKSWAEDYRYELGGESEQSDEGMSSIGAKLPLGFAIIVLLLIVQFNSVRKTFIVLCTVPLGVIGVIIGLHAFRSYFGFFAFLGIISLAGIVINNAIVLIDRIRIEIEDKGHSTLDGIRAACQHRLRPILLTTLTTTLGLVPLYLGGGLMWEPMAVSIMCGLLFATLITLVFVPVLYSLLFRTGSGRAKGEAQ